MTDKRKQWLIIWNNVVNAKIDYKTSKMNVSTNQIVKEAHIRKQTGLEWIRKAKAVRYLRAVSYTHLTLPTKRIV